MEIVQATRVESRHMGEFAKVMQTDSTLHMGRRTEPGRLELDQTTVKNGLGQLVLTVVKLLHELLERQAIRRMEACVLTDAEIERLGVTLMMQAQEIERLRKEFGLEEEDLNLDLGPLGKLF